LHAGAPSIATFLNVRFLQPPTSAKGTEHSVTTGRFHEAKFHWPLSGNHSWKAKVASVPVAEYHFTEFVSEKRSSKLD